MSFTNATSPFGYTQLDPSLLSAIRASFDSSNLLPFLSGSRPILSRRFPDETRSDASIIASFASGLIALVFVAGIAAGVFVPKLPVSEASGMSVPIPQRGFGLYTWLAVLWGDGVWEQVERQMRGDGGDGRGRGGVLDPLMSEDDVGERLGEIMIRYSP